MSLGEVAASENVRRTLFAAERRCYVARATITLASDVVASDANYRQIAFKSVRGGVTALVASVNSVAGWTGNTLIDGGFAASEIDAYLEPGDLFYAEITAAGKGAALSDLILSYEVLGL